MSTSMADLFAKSDALSDDEARLDQLVEAASQPSLATLMQRAKDAGHIKPVVEYGHPITA